MSIQSEARRDAEEYARAQMFYGEGAGTRRKLINAAVDSKSERSDEYAAAFDAELQRQNMAEHAAKAQKERKRKDRVDALGRNVKGLTTGNAKTMNTSVVVLLSGAYLAHSTGLDKKAYEYGKRKYENFKVRIRAFRQPPAAVYNITNVQK